MSYLGDERQIRVRAREQGDGLAIVVELCGSEALPGRFERLQPRELVAEEDGRRLLAGGGNLLAQLRLAIR